MEARPLMSGGPVVIEERERERETISSNPGQWREKRLGVVSCTDVDLSVKASWSHKGRIQDVGSVGPSQNHHIGSSVETCV